MCGNNSLPKNQRLPKNATDGQIAQWNTPLKAWVAVNMPVITPQPAPVIDVVYNDLLNMMKGADLVSGHAYCITDYRTIYKVSTTDPYVINTGPIEPLTVFAISDSTIHAQVFSSQNPFDILHYDILDNICEDNLTLRPGKITFRHDTINDVSCHFDWLNVKHRRYKVSTTAYPTYDPFVTYLRNQMVLYNDSLWVSTVPQNIGHTPNADNNWCKVLSNISTLYQLYDTTCSFGGFTVIGNPNAYKDYYTFHNSSNGTLYRTHLQTTHIGSVKAFAPTEPYNNIVIQVPDQNSWIYGNQFGDECRRMNFSLSTGKSFFRNHMLNGVIEIIGRDFASSTLWDGAGRLCFGTSASVFTGLFIQSVFGDGSNTISAQYCNNTFFVGSNVNINIVGAIQNGTIGYNNSRLFIERPIGLIYIMGNNSMSGAHIGCHAGNFTMTTGRLSSTDTTIDLFFSKTFTGAPGHGGLGSVILDDVMCVPSGYRIDRAAIIPVNMIGENTSVINLGFTGSPNAGIDDTTGSVPVIVSNAPVYKLSPNKGPSNSDTNLLTLSVSGTVAIISGTLKFHVQLVRTP